MPVPIAVIIAWISRFESTLLTRFFSALMTLPRSGRMAWNSLSRASLAVPPADWPSTRKISADSGSPIWQSASLPGSDALERALPARQLARLPRRLPRARRVDRFG
jgi:hypothetical protein